MIEPDRPRMKTIWRMRIAYWVTKATNTHSEYVILIAFPLQQWLCERASMLRYTYIDCRVLWMCFIAGEYSMLLVSFHLQRHMGNFLIQVYGPCCLLVVLSWVSFWLNREATADRVSLGKSHRLALTTFLCAAEVIYWLPRE